jgi:hypothetical protein
VCRYCADGSPDTPESHARVLHLMALIEHPDALPAKAALRIAGELLVWAGQVESRFRCEPATALEPPMNTVA